MDATRDADLVRGISTTGLAASVVNSVVCASIFTLPAVVAQQAGAAAPLAYGLTAVIMAGVTICFAEAGSRVPTSGGAYGSVEAAFGPAAGFVVGMLFLVTDALASGGIAAAFADMLGAAWPALAAGSARLMVILTVYGMIAWANLASVRTTARLITAASLLKIAPLLLLLALGLISLGHAAPAGPPPPPVTFAGFGRGLILTLFAFEGMEIALGASGEVRDPCRTLPRALFIAMLAVLALYLGVQLSAQHLLGSGLATAAAPLADAARRFGAAAQTIMLAGAGISMLGYMTGDVLGTSRMVFALARDRRLPRGLGAVHRRTGVPARAVIAYVAAALLLAVTGSFLELVTLSALATVAIYILVCAAAVVLRRRHVALAGRPLDFPALPVAAGVGLAGMAGMLARPAGRKSWALRASSAPAWWPTWRCPGRVQCRHRAKRWYFYAASGTVRRWEDHRAQDGQDEGPRRLSQGKSRQHGTRQKNRQGRTGQGDSEAAQRGGGSHHRRRHI